MSWRGVFAGALVLIALEAVLRSEESVGRFGELFTSVGELAQKAMSPAVAAIPNLARFSDDDDGTARKGTDADGNHSWTIPRGAR